MQDTTIQVKGSTGWKFKIALGAIGLVVIVILAALYRLEIGVIAMAIGLGYGAKIIIAATHQRKLSQYEQRRLLADVAKAEAEAIRAKAQSYFVETNTGVFQLEGISVERFYPAVGASKFLADVPQLPAPEPIRLRRLFDVEFIHLLVVGPSGAGKSTVACHLIDNAPYNAMVYVLDPHKSQNEQQGLVWPDRSIVIGDGRNWRDIDNKMIELMSEMNSRYQPKATFSPVYVVCDEWLTVRKECLHADDFFEKLGSEARKVDMHLIIATISHTVDDLKCSAPVRDNLMQLRLDTALKQQNRGELKQGKSNSTSELVELPGAYRQRALLPRPESKRPVDEDDLIGFDAGPVSVAPDATELRIFQLYQKGLSLRAISREIYGSIGGRQVEEIKTILEKMGVSKGVSDVPNVS